MELDQFKEKFIEEANGYIQQLETALLDLEDRPDDEESTSLVFRIMHTLKGVSSMYGFDAISELVHDLETIFEYIRDKKASINNQILDVTLNCVDHLRILLSDETLSTKGLQDKQNQLLNQIKVIVESLSINQASIPEAANEEESIKGKSTYYIIY